VESFDMHPNNQYILSGLFLVVSVLLKCVCQASLLSRCSLRYFTLYSLEVACCLHGPEGTFLFTWWMWWNNFYTLAFILHVLNQFWTAAGWVCSFCEAMFGSLSVASTAVSLANYTDYALLFTSSSRHNSSLDTWRVLHMTAPKFKPLIFPV
jgi:hypothetical protein